MPVVVNFDLNRAETHDHNRIQSLFERLGWENLGGSSYRYTKLGTDDQPVEDWLNHVIPALMLFRSLAINRGNLSKFTLDVQSSSGFNEQSGYGTVPQNTSDVLYAPTNGQFGERNLIDWLDGTIFPYD